MARNENKRPSRPVGGKDDKPIPPSKGNSRKGGAPNPRATSKANGQRNVGKGPRGR